MGIKKLKKGIHKEKALYSDFTSQGGWIPPDILQLIRQLTAELDNLQGIIAKEILIALISPSLIASLRSLRQQQESELRTIMNAPALGPPLERLYLGDLKMQQKFIPKILEIQVDLSEMYRAYKSNVINYSVM